MSNNSPLTIIPALSAAAIKYRLQNSIADAVMPRQTVDKQEFIQLSDRIADWISPVDTDVGRTGKVNQLANTLQDPVYLATKNQGLDEPVPNQDDMNAPSESALMRATEHVMGNVMRKREQRVAAIVGNSANYAYSDSPSVAWSTLETSDPLSDILTYLDKPYARPNKLIMGRDVWTVLSMHPKFLAKAATNIRATKQDVADILEVDEIIVGDGWINTAAKGKTAVKQRIWGKFLAGIYQGSVSEGLWGYTAQFGNAVSGTIPDPDIGLFGGVRVRAGESVLETVVAPEFGFLLTNVIA